MNPEAPTDWKLMAKRLSFTNDDLTSWATHEDPCMGVLTEWFATHKSSEATRAVYIVLKEMNREDAVEIVTDALEMAGKCCLLICETIYLDIRITVYGRR